MQIFKIVMLGVVLSLSLVFSGCQGTNSDSVTSGTDDNISSPIAPPSSDANQTVVKLSIVNGNKITVTGSGEEKDIYIVGFNANSSTDVVGEIGFQYPADFVNNGTDLGYVSPSKVALSDGMAHFIYKAPADLKAREDENYTGAVFTFYDMANPSVTIELQVDFNSSSDYAVTDPVLSTLILSPSALKVSQDKQSLPLTLFGFTDQSTMNINADITIKYPREVIDNKIDIGSLPSTLPLVDGRVSFSYTGPENEAVTVAKLEAAGLGHSVLVNFFNATTGVNVDLNISFEKAPEDDYSSYKLTSIPSAIVVSEPSQEADVKLYLEDNNSRPVANETILVDYFDGSKGQMDKFEGVTDANGYIVFKYTAPETLPDDGDLVTMTFRGVNTTLPEVNTTVEVNTTSVQTPNIHVDLEDSILKVTQDGQTSQVRIVAFDDNDQPFNSGSIIVRYPKEIVDDNISGGKFLESEVAISNGEAIFNFVGPNPLVDMQPMNFTFIYKENSEVNATLTVQYTPVLPTVILTQDTYELTVNNEIVNINVNVYDENNNPYQEGNVKIVYPDDVKEGRDIGSFTDSIVTLANGVATFVYTAPSNLDENTSDIVFQFYHEKNPTSPQTFTFTLNPDENQTILTSYSLESSISDGNVTMDLSSSKLLSFFVKDSNDELVDDNNMTSIKMTLLNPTLGTLEDNNGNSGVTLTIEDKNNVTVNLRSNTISGIIPIQVDANFTDANDENQTLSYVYNVIVLSGPPTTMSLSYAGTTLDDANAKFIESWVLTVTDRYNNKVNTNPAVSMGMLAGYAQSSAETSNDAGYLYYRTFDGNGTLDGDDDTLSVNSTLGSSDVFGNVDDTNDYLVTFGNGYTYNASGKWNITSNSDLSKLDLVEDYNGSTTSGLGFAVGNNKRQDMCEDGTEWNGNVYPENGDPIIGDTGSIRLSVEYDYYMVGKDVVLWVNLVGRQNSDDTITKIGEARKITLRGTGLTGESYSFGAGFEGVVHLHVNINDTVEYLKNANFGYVIEVLSDDANWTESDNSMDHNITYCYGDANQSGEVYVDVNFTSETQNAGTVTLKNVLISNEF